MTREEAIKILKEERWYMSRYSEEYKEAYDMAIEALSKPNYETDTEVRLAVTNRKKEKIILWDAYGEVEYYPAEQTEYKMPGHDEVMEALDKLTIRKVTDKDETEYLNQTFRHDDGEWHDLTDTLKVKPRLVDANDLMDNLPCLKIKKLDCDFCSFYKNKTSECLLEKWIGNAHTVSARPHGEWIMHIDDLFPQESTQECSNCHEHETIFVRHSNYCPNCGAQMDMRGESEEDV